MANLKEQFIPKLNSIDKNIFEDVRNLYTGTTRFFVRMELENSK